MKAAVFIGPGSLKLAEHPAPKKNPGEILLEVRRAGICGTDLRIFQGHMKNRVGNARILGHEMAATVKEISPDAEFDIGDRVVVEPTIFCGNCPPCRRGSTHVCKNLRLVGIDQDGAFQQFLTVPPDRLHKLPDAISDDHAVMIEPLSVAVHAVRLASLRAGETVAVIGGGTIGLLIAILAEKTGAKVVVLETNSYRRDLARQFHLETCNPKEQDAGQFISDFTSGAGANVVFEASGSREGALVMTSLAAIQGRIIIVGIHDNEVPTNLFQVFFKELSFQGVRAYAACDFKEAIRLIFSGEINPAPFLSRHYPLEKIQEAMEFALSGATVMKILIDIPPSRG
jgi:(R,R)-butanediol dehydrogenase / meso-butanediol dehydrogenase / diacetyl reductase